MKISKLKFGDLEGLMEYTENNPDVIHNQTFDLLSKTWGKKKKFVDVDLFLIEFSNDPELEEVILTVYKEEWIKALEMGLEFFEEKEEYEQCSKINELLITIKTN